MQSGEDLYAGSVACRRYTVQAHSSAGPLLGSEFFGKLRCLSLWSSEDSNRTYAMG